MPVNLENMFTKYALTKLDKLSLRELWQMTEGNRDCIQVEMLLLYYVAKDEKGFLSKEAVRGSWSTFPKCTRTLTERPINFHFLLISPK
ncbi:hypothetical protein ES332_D05G335600v1 [Gossypium tomentosum]|uniref:Uncharacterized protein n=1 Tax=Gossypium tomentosum TaxID=34277 RepID=A0A5D2L2I5_GOSTO|nr:hypothetical protein ES332_D05G335600v1 [Gossypium tomentosum]